MVVVPESDIGFLKNAKSLHVNLVITIHQDVRHRNIGHQSRERPCSQRLIQEVGRQPVPFGFIQWQSLGVENLANKLIDSRLEFLIVEPQCFLLVEFINQTFMQVAFDGLILDLPAAAL